MEKYELGTVIAERDFSLPGGRTITVKVGMPQASSPDGHFFFCPYEITGLQNEIAGLQKDRSIRRAGGVDSIQAIQLAFDQIGVELYELNRIYRNALRWEGGEEGDLGFPLPQNIMDILEPPASASKPRRTSPKRSRSKRPTKKGATKRKK